MVSRERGKRAGETCTSLLNVTSHFRDWTSEERQRLQKRKDGRQEEEMREEEERKGRREDVRTGEDRNRKGKRERKRLREIHKTTVL